MAEPLIEGLVVEIERREVYGKYLNYPVNDFAKVICSLLGQQTLTEGNIKKLQKVAAIHSHYKHMGAESNGTS